VNYVLVNAAEWKISSALKNVQAYYHAGVVVGNSEVVGWAPDYGVPLSA
jgi:hypothetical protein